jgi:hypothetical protein
VSLGKDEKREGENPIYKSLALLTFYFYPKTFFL